MNSLKIKETGEVINLVSYSINQNLESWLWNFSAEIATEADLLKLMPAKDLRTDYVEVLFRLGNETWELIIDAPSADNTGFQYNIAGYSKTAVLGDKFAEQISQTWHNTMAHDICESLCNEHGINLLWVVPDWPVKEFVADKLYPIDIILKLVGSDELGAKALALPTGTLYIFKGCKNPKELQSLPHDYELSTDRNIFERGYSYINNENFNQVMVVNADESDNSVNLSLEQQDSGQDKLLKIYIAPFAQQHTLTHTSGANVAVSYEGIKTELNTDDVLLQDGKGQLSKGFFSLHSLDWQQNNAGSLSIAGNGNIECATQQFGLVKIGYATRFHQYRFHRQADIDLTGVQVSVNDTAAVSKDSVTLMFDDGKRHKEPVIVKTLSTEEVKLFRAESELYRQVYDADHFDIGDCAYQGNAVLPGMVARLAIKRDGRVLNGLVLSVSITFDGNDIKQAVELEIYRV